MGSNGGDGYSEAFRLADEGLGGFSLERVQEVSDGSDQFSAEELDEIQLMRNTPDFFNKLVGSIAPTISGHQDIKRAILLMLMSGVHKSRHEGIDLRGDINVCIVGDPSCAKSHFLKYTAGLVPRSVYTSGKSAELTATVAKLSETDEFCNEADNGICCIDEFDKMDVRDQVAIHEAMKRQTISTTKDGMQATTSILAAVNTTGDHYDKTKHLKDNVALPPAILSRFHLVYVMIDDPERFYQEPLSPTFATAQVKRYISYAKTLKPQMTREASRLLAESYVSLHKGDTAPVRQLEALIRLSIALARCHLDIQVQPCYVPLAVRLLKTSIIQ